MASDSSIRPTARSITGARQFGWSGLSWAKIFGRNHRSGEGLVRRSCSRKDEKREENRSPGSGPHGDDEADVME